MPELYEFYTTNSVGLRFREVVKKMKERGKTNELKKPTKWAGKVWREKTRVRANLGKKFKNIIIS